MVKVQRNPLRVCDENVVQAKLSRLAELDFDIKREVPEQVAKNKWVKNQ